MTEDKRNILRLAKDGEALKSIYPLGATYYQYFGRTPNELFSDTLWECRGKIQGVPWWVRIK